MSMNRNIYVINKPLNWTSNDVVRKLKSVLKLKKIGHGGTLDPLATGVLIIGIDKGTKLLCNNLNEDKQYITTIEFGYMTTTYDLEGEVTNRNDIIVEKQDLIKALEELKYNEYKQVPPIYSAIKIDGKPAYQYARENKPIELKSRVVNLIDYSIIDFKDNVLKILVDVSKGFYIRSFAVDLAKKLDTFGTIVNLNRTKSGIYTIEEALTIEEFINGYKKN